MADSLTLTPEQRTDIIEALDIAADAKRHFAATCPDCDKDPSDLCAACLHRLARADRYESLSETLSDYS